MFSYTNEDIMKIVNDYYKGISLSDISMEHKIPVASIYYFVKLVKIVDKDKPFINQEKFNPSFKQEVINRVLINGEKKIDIALEYRLKGVHVINNWLSKFNKDGYDMVYKKEVESLCPTIKTTMIS